MAKKNQKLVLNMDIQTSFSNIKSQMKDLQDVLGNLAKPFENTKAYKDYQNYLNNYIKTLNKITNTTWTPKNVSQYKSQVENLQDSYAKIQQIVQDINDEWNNNNLQKQQTALSQIEKIQSRILQKRQNAAKKLGVDSSGAADIPFLTSTASKAGYSGDQAKIYTQVRSELKKLEADLEAANAEYAKTLKLNTQGVNNLKLPFQQMETGVQGAEEQLKSFNVQIDTLARQQASQGINNLVTQFLGFNAVLNIGHNAIRQLKDTLLDLDESLTAIAAVTGKTREQMWDMVGTYNEMAFELGTTTRQIAESAKLYYQQGRTQSEVTELVEQTAILATTAEIEYATATDYLTAAVNGYNLAAEEAYRVTDSWSALAAASAVDVNELAVAMSKVASLAAASGLELETASAFLSKMLETTREAPENLGTALKTIISRFQDLKMSEEELEDGVDANDVEKALKSVGVDLRDSLGQFREFDDVLLDLSRIWDTLSINSQKYIATIAAGSRQQSRFIALVEDYERNLELIDIAQDSAGASTAQFSIMTDGLQTSLNRLTAAWEGFYTSFEQGPTVVSSMINLLADVINSLNEFGIAQTTVTLALAGTIIKVTASAAAYALDTAQKNANTAATLENAAAQIYAGNAASGLKIAFTSLASSVKMNAAAFLAQKASLLGVIAPYAAIIAAVAGLAGGLIYLATARERNIKKLQEENKEYSNQANILNQQSKSLDGLLESYEKAVAAGEDLSTLQQTLIDQFPELADKINLVTDSVNDVKEGFKEYRAELAKEAADQAFSAIKTQYELEKATAEDRYNVKDYEKNLGPAVVGGTQYVENKIVYEADGKTFETKRALLNYLNKRDFIPDSTEINSIFSAYNYLYEDASDAQTAALKKYFEDNWENLVNGVYSDEQLEQNLQGKVEIVRRQSEQLQKTMAAGWMATASGGIDNSQFEKRMEEFSAKSEELLQKFYKGDTSVTAEEQNLLAQMFGGTDEWKDYVEKQSAQVEQLVKSFTSYSELLKLDDKQLETIGINTIGKLGTAGTEALLQQLSAAETSEEWQQLYSNMMKVSDEVQNLSTGDIIVDLTDVLEATTDSTKGFNLLQNILDNFSAEEAEQTIKALAESINLLDIDMDELVTGPVEDYYEAMDKFKSATEEGLSLADYDALMMEFPEILSETSFGFDEFTGKVVMNKDAAIEASEAIRKLKLEEQESNIQTALLTLSIQDATLAKMGITNATFEEATAILANRSAALEEEMQMQRNIIVAEQERIVSENLEGQKLEEANARIANAYAAYSEAEANKGNIDSVKGQITEYFNKNKILQSATATQNYFSDAEEESSKATDAQTEALEAQKDVLEANKEALEDQVEALEKQKEALEDARDAAKDYVDILADAIQNRLEDELDAASSAVENYYEALNSALDELISGAQDKLDGLNDAANDAKDLAEENSDALQEQADLVIEFYDSQIQAIQDKIDAMNAEADSLDRLQKLQEARDAYEQAKQKTRLVLIEGAGWRFRTDKDALQEAGETLATTETENQVELLEQQIEQLENIKNKWEEIADNIGKATSELEKTAAFKEFLSNASPEQLDQLYNQFTGNVNQNNTLFENALQAQYRYELENDASAEGTLAWQIAQWQAAQEQAAIDQNQYNILTDPNAKAVEELKKQLLQQLGSASEGSISDALATGLEIISENAEIVNSINTTLEALEELLTKVDMTSDEIAQYNEIQNMVGQASLDALLEGGSVYNKLKDQVNGIVALNDQILVIEQQIAALEDQIDVIQGQIDSVDDQIQSVKDSIDSGFDKATNAFKNYAESVKKDLDSVKEEITYSRWKGDTSSVLAPGGRIPEAAVGGVDQSGGYLKVHGTQNRPELILNNSQSAGLFNFIDSLTRLPTLTSLDNFGMSQGNSYNSTYENGLSFSNCTFEISTNADNFENLVLDIKRQAHFK